MINRRILLSAAIALPLAACVTDRTPLRQKGLRLATFNIWHNQKNWSARQPLLIEALRAVDADVIALQEVLEDTARNLPNQADTIARALGDYSVQFVSTDPVGASRRYGNAIITRLPVIAEAFRTLEPSDDYRTALRVRVQTYGGPLDVVVTHLAWQKNADAVRARQVADLLSWLPTEEVPAILMGDFNAPLSDPSLAALAMRFQTALPQNSVPTTLNPAEGHDNRVIDHIIFERTRLKANSARLIGNLPENGVYPSDHFGLAAQIEFL